MPGDWIDSFMSATDSVRSPESFRLWTGITTLAAILDRRAYTVLDGPDPLKPNMFTVLAGGPASGKSLMVTIARKLLSPLPDMFIAPDNPNKPTFLDALEQSARNAPDGMPSLFYCPMTVLCTEMGVLISKYEADFVADLTTIYDNPPNYTAPRRNAKSLNIEAPTLNMLMAATPDALGDIIPESAWGQGFTSRLIFVYGTAPDKRRKIFSGAGSIDLTVLQKEIEVFYREINGEFSWEEDAQAAVEFWYNDEKQAPVPNYGRLVNYCGRRNEHLIKLSMISAVSAGNGMTVTLKDFRRAQNWLFSAEKTMPDVFRAIAQKSDFQLVQDLHHHCWRIYNTMTRENRKPVHDSELWLFLETRTTSDKIPRIIAAAEKSGYLKKNAFGTGWIPKDLTLISDKE